MPFLAGALTTMVMATLAFAAFAGGYILCRYWLVERFVQSLRAAPPWVTDIVMTINAPFSDAQIISIAFGAASAYVVTSLLYLAISQIASAHMR
jgi:hypothetical protein